MRILAVAVLSTALLLARGHTALNGTWVLEPTQSDFNGQSVMQTGTVTINERDGNITVARNFTYEGNKETFFYKDMVDSQNGATIHDGGVKSKARWDHGALKVTTMQGGAVITETYSLSPNGTMTANVVKPGEQADNFGFHAQIAVRFS